MSAKFTQALVLMAVASSAFAARPVLNIHEWQTKAGTPVLFVPAHEIPMVDVQVAFAAGSARDNGKPGLASLTTGLLDEGTTKGSSADQIADRFAEVGAEYRAQAARDMTAVTLRSLSDPAFLNPAVANFVDVLTKPAFSKEAFKREQNSQLAMIAQAEQQADDIADRLFYSSIYGTHPYSTPIMGTLQSVQQLTAKDVNAHYQQYFSAKNAVIAIVGDLSEEQARKISDTITSGLPTSDAAPVLPEPIALTKNIETKQAFPASQTNIRMGMATLAQNNQDYFPLLVGNYTLGGGMLVSRLVEQVREKQGLSYSVYSAFQPMASKGPFLVSLGTKNAKADQALALTQSVLTNFMQTGPTTPELKDAKSYLTGSFPLRFDSNKSIANNLLVLGFYHLPRTFYDTYRNNVNLVQKDQITEAFKRHVHLGQMAIVRVGGDS